MNAQIVNNTYFDEIEYYPLQMDLDKNIYLYYQQLENHPQFFSIYKEVYLDDDLISKEVLNAFATSSIFESQKFPDEILKDHMNFRFNILNAFKLYVMLQESIKLKKELDIVLMECYQKLDHFFNALKSAPQELDLRTNKREIVPETVIKNTDFQGLTPTVLMLVAILIALYLMVFSSGLFSLICQAFLYGFIFLMAKSLRGESSNHRQAKDDHVSVLYTMHLDYFFEKYGLKHSKENPQ